MLEIVKTLPCAISAQLVLNLVTPTGIVLWESKFELPYKKEWNIPYNSMVRVNYTNNKKKFLHIHDFFLQKYWLVVFFSQNHSSFSCWTSANDFSGDFLHKFHNWNVLNFAFAFAAIDVCKGETHSCTSNGIKHSDLRKFNGALCASVCRIEPNHKR